MHLLIVALLFFSFISIFFPSMSLLMSSLHVKLVVKRSKFQQLTKTESLLVPAGIDISQMKENGMDLNSG